MGDNENSEDTRQFRVDDGQSWLNADRVYITDQIYIRIPTVGEILYNEQDYYSTAFSMTATPYQYMVQLDDLGIDFTKVSDYELFTLLFPMRAQTDISLIFGNLLTDGYMPYRDPENNSPILMNPQLGLDYKIDEFTYLQIAKVLRKINNFERCRLKPGNEEGKKYLLEKERKRLKRHANKPYDPYLEKLVIALVNRPEFKYNYEQVMDLSIYKFNQSLKQIQTSISFDNTMIGVYAGTVDVSKVKDKSCLSWIPLK